MPTESPLYPRHPERRAIGTCVRCCVFVCEECGRGGDTCQDCLGQALAGLPSSAGRARWAIYLLVAHLLFKTGAGLAALAVGSKVTVGSALLTGLIGLGSFGMYVGAVTLSLMWLHLAARQAEALRIRLGFSPGWVVGIWFVPLANLVLPYRAIDRLARGLGGRELARPLHLGLWWGLWVAGNVLSKVDALVLLQSGPASRPPSVTAVKVLAVMVLICAGGLFMSVVQGLQRQRDARRQ